MGRPVRRYVANLARLHLHVRDVARTIVLFKQPWSVLRDYVRRQPPASGCLELRSGLRIFVSHDPLDVVTVVGIFVRRDYGLVEAGSEVIDIGANIGVFTLFAAHCGAARVHCYEPSAEAFACLARNVRENALESRVAAHQVAVGAGPERSVMFPRQSSVFNAIGATRDGECDPVRLETLATVVARLDRPALIKLDCEGEEEFILSDASDDTVRKVTRIRFEYHKGRGAAIMANLVARGFAVEHVWAADDKGGLVWMRRLDSVAARP